MKPFVEGGGESLTRLPSPDLHKTAGLRAGSLSLHRSTPDGPSEYRPPPALEEIDCPVPSIPRTPRPIAVHIERSPLGVTTAPLGGTLSRCS